jgi:hypothetical protein
VKDNTSMLRLLLSLGADSNLTGGLYHTALQAACLQPKDDDDDNEPARGEENDWEDDKTDDGVNRDDDSEDEAVDSSNDDDTAEEDAAEENEKDEDQDDGKSAYEILVEAGADVNANGGKFGTALQTAHSYVSSTTKPYNKLYCLV